MMDLKRMVRSERIWEPQWLIEEQRYTKVEGGEKVSTAAIMGLVVGVLLGVVMTLGVVG